MPVTLTRKQWETCLIVAGLTASEARSAHLKELTEELGRYEDQIRLRGWIPFTALLQKFRAWDEGQHDGEHLLLKRTPEYAALKQELAAPDAPKPLPPLPNKMLLAVWNCVHDAAWHQLSHAQRHTQLDEVIRRVMTRLATIPPPEQTRSPVKAMLLVPEYQYTAVGNSRYPMTEAEKVLVEEALRLKSAANPELLLLAGTSHYFKDENRGGGAATHKVNPATGLRDTPKANVPRRERALADLKLAKAHAPMIGQGWTIDQGYDARPAKPIYIPPLSALKAVLKDGTSTPRFVRTAAYLFHAGRRIARYDKQMDFTEALNNSPDDMMYIPGTQLQCPEVGNRRYGIEVCLDHGRGALVKRNPPELQFHLVVSDWVTSTTAHMAMCNGGYFVHASTNAAENCVYQRPGGGGEPVKVQRSGRRAIGGGKLEYFHVTEPQPV